MITFVKFLFFYCCCCATDNYLCVIEREKLCCVGGRGLEEKGLNAMKMKQRENEKKILYEALGEKTNTVHADWFQIKIYEREKRRTGPTTKKVFMILPFAFLFLP